jgi:hypothetical protein
MVEVYGTNGMLAGFSETETAGTYELGRLPSGPYYLRTYSGSLGFVDEWHADVPVPDRGIPADADPVPVAAGMSTNINFGLGFAIVDMRVTNSHAQVYWQAASGTVYRVQRSGNLLNPVWTNAPSGALPQEQGLQTSPAQQVLEYRDPAVVEEPRFYRLRISAGT